MADFHQLLNSIFMCGEQEVQSIINAKKIKYVVDLRAEANESIAKDESTEWVHIPLEDGIPDQSRNLRKAISYVAKAYLEGKETILH
ncbi:hypothetical protein [Salipaludibacillus daqingensis]|uniref:hypothetical protein n=1 Tax=Salipaludibacillus daqingensis TaxID=3041001 RepID=UPI0024764C63|nr:hypothetical protein [Salipaludibacillus daqingensis]